MFKTLKEVADYLDKNGLEEEADILDQVSASLVSEADQLSPVFNEDVVNKGPLPSPGFNMNRKQLERGYKFWSDRWGEEAGRWFLDSSKLDPDLVSEIEYKFHIV